MTNLETYDRLVLATIDVQNDFCPGGALGVKEGNLIVPTLNALARFVRNTNGQVVFTRDWHPEQTAHFQEYGGMWVPHCVAETPGAELHEDLNVQPDDIILNKGTSTTDDGYSGFEAVADDGTTLEAIAEPKTDEHVALLIGGLATDYCVKATVLDACKLADSINYPLNGRRLDVYVIQDAIRAVNLNDGDDKRAMDEMKVRGARFVNAHAILDSQAVKVGR